MKINKKYKKYLSEYINNKHNLSKNEIILFKTYIKSLIDYINEENPNDILIDPRELSGRNRTNIRSSRRNQRNNRNDRDEIISSIELQGVNPAGVQSALRDAEDIEYIKRDKKQRDIPFTGSLKDIGVGLLQTVGISPELGRKIIDKGTDVVKKGLITGGVAIKSKIDKKLAEKEEEFVFDVLWSSPSRDLYIKLKGNEPPERNNIWRRTPITQKVKIKGLSLFNAKNRLKEMLNTRIKDLSSGNPYRQSRYKIGSGVKVTELGRKKKSLSRRIYGKIERTKNTIRRIRNRQ